MTMRPEHPLWEEFVDRMSGPEGVNFTQEDLTTLRPPGGPAAAS